MEDNRRGFASAEMLVVLLLIGMLAGVGLPRYAATKENARVARMVDDLRNLAVSEEAYFADHATYYRGVLPSTALAFQPSAGVTLTIDSAAVTGWSATASTMGTSQHCVVFYGDAAPSVPAAGETQAACTR